MKTEEIKYKEGRDLTDKEKKAILLETLISLEVMHDTFTGKLLININQGGMTGIEKTHKLLND